jgi:C-terminal processing protease CtpA/Prc
MKKNLIASAAALLAFASVAPAFAGGANCASHSSAAAASSEESCHGKSAYTAWAGAWLQRSSSGQVVVADVTKGSPAAKAGLKSGDVVLAVNGYSLADSKEAAMCASNAECKVGRSVAYTVQRGGSKKNIKFKLAEMPSDATARFAARNASFDPALAAVVIPSAN